MFYIFCIYNIFFHHFCFMNKQYLLACNATHYGVNCANTCSCNLNNTVDCNDTTGECLCAAGWNGITCDEDVNECLNASYCPGYMEVCFNLNGSAECRCEIGFQRSTFDLKCQGKEKKNFFSKTAIIFITTQVRFLHYIF